MFYNRTKFLRDKSGVKLFDATLDEVFRSQFEWFVTMNKA
jgi:hypothetical protein